LGAEALFAVFAQKPLDTVWRILSPVVANLLVGPGIIGIVVVKALSIGAKRRSPGYGCCFYCFHV